MLFNKKILLISDKFKFLFLVLKAIKYNLNYHCIKCYLNKFRDINKILNLSRTNKKIIKDKNKIQIFIWNKNIFKFK